MRARLIAVWLLLVVSACATGFLLYEFYVQSSAVQLAKTETDVDRACHDIADRYAFFVAGWSGPNHGAIDDALRRQLAEVVATALAKAPGVEGGLWSADAGSLAYAYPTYEGTGPKTDLPAAETDTIRDANASALDAGRARLVTSAGRSQILVLLACPVRGPIARVTAWTMARVFTGRGPAYNQLLLGLAVLTFTVVASALFLGRVIVAYSRRIKTIETALAGHNDLSDLPEIAPSGERELDRIVSALNAAGIRLGEARTRVLTAERLAAIGAMAAGVAHEIRNPLAAMRLKSENALASDEPQRAKAALTVVVEQIDRLDELVGDLLSLAYFRAPKREPTDVGRVIAEAVKIHAGAASMRGVKVTTVCELGPEERPWLDPGQIRRAIGDLLANAIEALGERPDGHIHIEARRLAASEGNRLLIAVNDNGPGIAEELRDRLFEPFATTKGGSHGLGLAIVREIARAHDGDARYLRGADGARFEMVLPWLES